jgi:hypothetical protein
MTPAEAREIDRLEFEAECIALRQRAYALMSPRPVKEPKPVRNPSAPRGTLYTVGNVTLSISEWAARLGMSPGAIQYRLKRGWPVETAMTTPKGQPRPDGTVH